MKTIKILAIFFFTVAYSNAGKAQISLKPELKLKINLTEYKSKSDSVYNPQTRLKVECTGIDKEGLPVHKIFSAMPGEPILTSTQFQFLRVYITSENNEIKPQLFTIQEPKSIETIKMVSNNYAEF